MSEAQKHAPETGTIRVSFDQLFSEVHSLREAMARIETKLDNLSSLEPRVRELENLGLKEKLEDLEERMRETESRRWPHSLLGILATILGTAALLWQAIHMK